MAQRFVGANFQFVNSAGLPYAGGFLYFYATGTSDPLDTYTTSALSVANANPVVLNSAGWPATAIYLQNLAYKVVLKDSLGNEIWTADPVMGTDFASVPIWTTTAGSPNGTTAGTAASSGVLPSLAWDRVNGILYICTTTGSTSTAVWTAINAQAATATVTQPQGYLSLVNSASGGPILTGDAASATAVYYMPYVGNLIPIYNGSRMIPTEFSELTLSLASQHALSTLYDVFAFSNSGVVTLVTGPAWSVSTAGSGARGSGAGTTQLTRLNGYWVNAVSMSTRNGSTTYTVGANLGTYLGSIFIDGTAGQITCHRAWGSSRKWGVWNAYNRQPLYLQAGDATGSWNHTSTIRASNGAATNSLTVFQGLPEEPYDLRFEQQVMALAPTAASAILGQNAIGWNSTSAASGRVGSVGHEPVSAGDDQRTKGNAIASFLQVPVIGINVVTALEVAPNTAGTVTWYGGQDLMVLSAKWRG